MIENSNAGTCPEVGTSGTLKESALDAEKTSPSAIAKGGDPGATEQLPLPVRGANTTGSGGGKARTGGGEAGVSGKSTIRVVPFQSLPESVQEELGKELFDDPLLTRKICRSLQILCNGASNSPR